VAGIGIVWGGAMDEERQSQATGEMGSRRGGGFVMVEETLRKET